MMVSPAKNKIVTVTTPEKWPSSTSFGTTVSDRVVSSRTLLVAEDAEDIEQESNIETLLQEEDSGQQVPPPKQTAEEELWCQSTPLSINYFLHANKLRRAELLVAGRNALVTK